MSLLRRIESGKSMHTGTLLTPKNGRDLRQTNGYHSYGNHAKKKGSNEQSLVSTQTRDAEQNHRLKRLKPEGTHPVLR